MSLIGFEFGCLPATSKDFRVRPPGLGLARDLTVRPAKALGLQVIQLLASQGWVAWGWRRRKPRCHVAANTLVSGRTRDTAGGKAACPSAEVEPAIHLLPGPACL